MHFKREYALINSAICSKVMEKSPNRDDQPEKTCARKLKKLKPSVTAEDRKLAMAQFGIAYITVWRYLRGDVANITLGLGLLQFFDKRIKQRLNDLGKL